MGLLAIAMAMADVGADWLSLSLSLSLSPPQAFAIAIAIALYTMEKKARNFREYRIWQEAVAMSTKVYEVTATLPYFEKKGLCDQLQRAVVSIASNIAEGCARPTDNDFAHFLDMALGSAYEVETQLLIAKNLNYLPEDHYQSLFEELQNIERQISALIGKVRR